MQLDTFDKLLAHELKDLWSAGTQLKAFLPTLTDAAQDADDSKTIKDHKALQNQSSIDPEDYPKGDRKAQSLVRKPGDKD